MNNIFNILTIDVEDWFHILGVDTISNDINIWNKYESRVVDNTTRILEILSKDDIKATFFVLGWIAERFPQLIIQIKERGHEIATHGYAHKLVYEQSPKEFYEDLKKSIDIIEGVTKTKVIGNRSAGFSITEKTPWAFDMIARAGLKYDSTVFPCSREHGGFDGAEKNRHTLKTVSGDIEEFPISVTNICGRNVAFSGGGYLRLLPYWLIKSSIEKLNKKDVPVVVYLHPRDLDPNQPRMRMLLKRKFKSYVNLSTTEAKLRSLIDDFHFVSIKEAIERQNR